jgi:predicted neutral ceramidase superfamily lipid hydrolase
MVAGPFILSIAMIPAMIFLPLSAWAANRENTAMVVIAAIPNLAWTYLVVAVSCVVVFSWVVSGQEGGFFQILWGYSVATAPWSFMAQKDRQSGNETSTTLMFFVQLGTISMMVATFLDPSDVDPSRLMVWFLPFFVLGLIAQLFIAWVETRGRRTLGY